jgi:hypothetical protein
MPGTLTQNEEAQLLQTIEMFEVITQSQPLDYQSLEILKEAYAKLTREKDVVNTSKRIAQAYVQLGQLSSAILEYESILQRYPGDPDVVKALAAIEDRANSFAAPLPPETDFVEKASAATALRNAADGKPLPAAEIEDGKTAMQKVFVDGKLISITDFNTFWPKVNTQEVPKAPVEPFIQTIAEKQLLPMDKALKILCEKARLGYIPLEKYDVDVDLARTFPKEVCLRWCVLPYDRMSKSIFVATANPFNKQALRELEAATKNRILFYLASPVELNKTLKKIFR